MKNLRKKSAQSLIAAIQTCFAKPTKANRAALAHAISLYQKRTRVPLQPTLAAILAVLISATAANAESITVGLWDAATPGLGIVPILSSPDGSQVMRKYVNGSAPNLGLNFAGNVTTLVLAPDSAGSVFREAAFDDVFNTGVSDTIRLFFNFQGVTAGSTNLTFPTFFQTEEFFPPSFSISEQIFTCANGATFCDNNLTGGGTLVGMTTFTSGPQTQFATFSGTVPATTFNLDLVFTIVSNGGAPPLGDVAGAILTQPDVTVPGPIVGAGLPGLLGFAFLALCRFMRRRKPSARPDFAGPRHWQIASH
jgi:hypothetical protein